MKWLRIFVPIIFFFCAIPVFAATTQVCTNVGVQIVPGSYNNQIRVSELLSNPVGDDLKGEFIELQNISDAPVDLSAWILEDASKKQYVIEDASIAAKGFVVFDRSVTGISLNNTGEETVTLYSPDKQKQDAIMYSGSVAENVSFAFGKNSWSWSTTVTKGIANVISIPNDPPTAKISVPEKAHVGQLLQFSAIGSTDPDKDKLDATWSIDGKTLHGLEVAFSFTTSGTKNGTVEVNDGKGGKDLAIFSIDVSPYDLSENVFINEVYPKPADGEQEWIEIANANDRKVELGGWKATDGVTTYIFPNSATVEPNGFFILNKDDSSISLNDTGDTATLYRPDDSSASTVTYPKATKGESYSWFGDHWEWTAPTQGKVNVSTQKNPVVLGATAAQASDLPTTVTNSGNPKSENFSSAEPFWQQFGPYLGVGIVSLIVFVILFYQWKKRRIEQDEFDVTE